MKLIQKIPQVEELCGKYPISIEEQKKRENLLFEVREILAGKSEKKIIIVGPCSADREDAVMEYVYLLAELQDRVRDTFLLIPRVYTGKPRTRGDGYKGMIHCPEPSTGHDDLVSGLIAVRELHQHIIKETGMYAADELLYPGLCSYVSDLLLYVAVGARSVENQEHRLAASGLDLSLIHI